jgi:WD40 repeat protein
VKSISPTGQVVSESTLAGIDANIPSSYWLSPDGKYLASVKEGNNEYELDIWSLASKKIINKYLFAEVAVPWTSGQALPVFAWSPDGHFIATAYTDQEEKITISRIALP